MTQQTEQQPKAGRSQASSCASEQRAAPDVGSEKEREGPSRSSQRRDAEELLTRIVKDFATEARPLPDGFDPDADEALAHPHLYFNRELSTLDFNRRVLAQALEGDQVPQLERVFFLAIAASNIDEFFRKRVGGLKRQAAAGVTDLSTDGRTPEGQLRLIRQTVLDLYAALGRLWDTRLRPSLAQEADIHLLEYDALSADQQEQLDRYFQENIFPILTPLAVGPGHPFPFLSNLSLSLAVMLHHPRRGTEHFARVKVPVIQGRWVTLEEGSAGKEAFVPLEQLVARNLDEVFRGMDIQSVHAFRVTRNADIRREEEEADDLLEMISDELRERRFAPVVRLEIDAAMPASLRHLLMRELDIAENDLYETNGLLGHADLMPLARMDRPEHRFAPWSPVVPLRLRAGTEGAPQGDRLKDDAPQRAVPTAPRMASSPPAPGSTGVQGQDPSASKEAVSERLASTEAAPHLEADDDGREALPVAPRSPQSPFAGRADRSSIFRILRTGGDLLVHHPYDSFRASVQRFVEEAADDPQVIAIKQTLYRTAEDSPVVQALMRAAERGKQVAVLVEVKARFDEKNNIEWGRMLEKSGVHVTYGLVGLKTHAKATLIVRQEQEGPRTYCHIGTGNYNSETARHYTDLGLLTCAPDIGYDLINLFHYLTGYAPEQHYRTMLVAPQNMRMAFQDLIRREVKRQRQHADGRIVAKMNALNDTAIIRELYRAARAGVQIDLIVRGHSLLRPGLEGISDNIRVISILGRFLEHTRVYYFGNGSGHLARRVAHAPEAAADDPPASGSDRGDRRSPKVFIGSADWMSRNLNGRVEAVQEVHQADLRKRLVGILGMALSDQRCAWELHADGRYLKPEPDDPEALGFQEQLMLEARQRQARAL